MKSFHKLISTLLLLLSLQTNGQSFKSSITYKLLKMDKDIWGENEKEIQACEKLMTAAVNRISRNYSPSQIKNANTPVGINILKMIDSTFTEFGFLYHTNSSDVHFDYLTPAFRKTFDAHYYLNDGSNENKYREIFWQNNQSGNCFLIDCDLYCIIYFGISQMLSLPLNIVETPGHTYIRWWMNDSEYFCWDTNEGEAHFDETTITGYGNVNSDNHSQFLQDWTVADIEGHYNMLKGDYYFFKGKKNMNKSLAEYSSAMSLRPHTSMNYCNYVWIYIMHPEIKGYNDRLLMEYINKAMSLETNLNFYDAKACLYAIQGDFKQAIKTEEQGLKLKADPYRRRQKAEGHLDCFRKKKVCRDLE